MTAPPRLLGNRADAMVWHSAKERDKMIKKISIVVAALGLAVAAPSAIEAKPVHKNVHINRAVHVNRRVGPRVVRPRGPTNKYVIGHSYNGHVWYGRTRHRWHGRWYAYGIGPCWINIGGLWFWNVAACP
jgi:hypothetical protein